MEVYREYVATNGPYVSREPGYEGGDQQPASELPAAVNEPDPVSVPKHAKPITRLLMLGAVGKKPSVHHAPYLREKTHLQMAGKNLSSLQVPASAKEPDTPILGGLCPKLQILYLENNYLSDMSGTLRGLPGLIQINLHGNQISQMNCFEECTQLRKLYLEANRINRLEGLQNCQRLEELYLGD